ncbi:unnamed protein product, partial [Orchesella dallaii]
MSTSVSSQLLSFRNQRTLNLEVVPIPRWLLSWSPVATKEGGGSFHGALWPQRKEVNSEVDTTDSELNKESYEHLIFLSALFILEPENFKFGGCTHSKVAPFMESCGHIRW